MNILDIAGAVAATGPDLNETKAGGGGEYTPPAKGVAMLRFVAYVEVGDQPQRPYKGQPKPPAPMAWLVFELHGKNYPVNEVNGEKIPVRMTVKVPVSQGEKAYYSKLFKAMNYEGNAKHFSQLLGKPFLGTVTHYVTQADPNATPPKPSVTIAELINREGISIRAPFVTNADPVSGETTTNDLTDRVPPAVSSLKLFTWAHDPAHTQAMWDSLYIKTPDGYQRSMNVFQDTIKKAVNFPKSQIATYLDAGGSVDLGNADTSVDAAVAAQAQAKSTEGADQAPATDAGSDADMAALGLT